MKILVILFTLAGLFGAAQGACAQPVSTSNRLAYPNQLWQPSSNGWITPNVDANGYQNFDCQAGCGGGSATPAAPYIATPVAPAQYGLSVTTATTLTVPAGATFLTIAVEGGPVRYSTTTTATATAGMPLDAGGPYTMMVTPGSFSIIAATSATTVIDVEYFK